MTFVRRFVPVHPAILADAALALREQPAPAERELEELVERKVDLLVKALSGEGRTAKVRRRIIDTAQAAANPLVPAALRHALPDSASRPSSLSTTSPAPLNSLCYFPLCITKYSRRPLLLSQSYAPCLGFCSSKTRLVNRAGGSSGRHVCPRMVLCVCKGRAGWRRSSGRSGRSER